MLTPEESAELRELQVKAYRPDGGLSSADAARLADLEERRVARVAVTPAPVAPLAVDSVDAVFGVAEDPPSDAEDLPAPSPSPAERTGSRWTGRRLLLAGAAAVAVGFGAGWLLFDGTLADGIRDLAHGDQVDLVEEIGGPFLPGSVEFVGEQGGVSVWFARKSDPAQDCIVMLAGETSSSNCQSEDETFAYGSLGASLTVSDDEGGQRDYTAMIANDTTGERVVLIHEFDEPVFEYNWEDQFSEAEVATARLIAAATEIDPESLSIIGYEDAQPIWYGYRGADTCIVVPQGDSFAWNCVSSAGADDLAVDRATDDGRSVEYTVEFTGSGSPVLTIDWRAGAGSNAE